MRNKPTLDDSVSLYVHIPFCISPRLGERELMYQVSRETRNAYLTALELEIGAAADLLQDRCIGSIFLGGTASVMSPDKLAMLLVRLKREHRTEKGMELTLTMVPETLCVPSLSGLNICNFNRISLRALSASDAVLKTLNASFRYADLEQGLQLLSAFTYPNLDLELLYGVPGQTLTTIRNTLITCTAPPGVKHITLREYELSDTQGVSDTERRDQYERAVSQLESAGFRQYAAGCFAKPEYECQSLVMECSGADRVGLGLGARSCVDGVCWQNTADLSHYIAHADDFTQIVCGAVELNDVLTLKRRLALGLRLADGIAPAKFHAANEAATEAVLPILDALHSEGLLETGDKLKLTTEGLRRFPEVQLRILE